MKILESGDHLVRKLHETLHGKFPLAAAEEILQVKQHLLWPPFLSSFLSSAQENLILASLLQRWTKEIHDHDIETT